MTDKDERQEGVGGTGKKYGKERGKPLNSYFKKRNVHLSIKLTNANENYQIAIKNCQFIHEKR